jgi:hypothetical protein
MATIKQGATTCTVDELLFPVEVRNEEMKCNKEYSRKIVGYVGGEEMLLNQCSDIYVLIPNQDIFPNIEQVLEANGIEYEVTYRHINHVRFYADYVITDKRFAYKMRGTNDLIMPMISVQHSYNGLTKYKIIFGYFRFICENGLVIAVEEMKQFNLVITGKHTENVRKSFTQLNHLLVRFSNEAENITSAIVKKYELLGGRMVTNLNNRLTEVLNAVGITAVDNKNRNTLEDITHRIMVEANAQGLGYNGRVTDFLVYNGINQYIHDDNLNIAAPETRMAKDSNVLEYMLENA